MPREKASTAAKRTDSEKMKIFFSMIEAAGKIDWNKVYIPPGRTRKAVSCMIDGERKKAGARKSDSNPQTPKSSVSTPASSKATPMTAKSTSTNGGKGLKHRASSPEEEEMKPKEDSDDEKTRVKRTKIKHEEGDGEDELPTTPTPARHQAGYEA